ncbi:OLC1v1021845C3 [Oldenlandia corymbosa var. corymbosa]|uniref:OLC1v1021845C3 n=1 Tax=Oldenlandia corymbosa var. corymbosa TaxID=529605 RepID=A0AAV1BWK1_OLDCO|nr:OLC1v1021845C3 [Oldenlandia corymbosa var. corymbosa]
MYCSCSYVMGSVILVFLQQVQDELLSMKHANKLREIVGDQLKVVGSEASVMELCLVDVIQRLRIDHHFQHEIDALLRRYYCNYLSMKSHFRTISISGSDSLYEDSLAFRLLRQEGYYVAPDVFNRFIDCEGRFNIMRNEKGDIKSLMELYEAAQLGVEGEDILEDAAKFSSERLTAWSACFDGTSTASKINHTLRHPYRKSLARFSSMNLMSNEFEAINGLEKSLKQLSTFENYMAQGIHRQELHHISKWWEDLGMAKELEHARDQPLKWYTWAMAIFNNLSLSNERMALAKTISFIYVIDDIFDLYGDPQDLNLFTQAVKRWELDSIEQLPDYMKKCFRAVYRVTNEAALKIQKKHGFNPLLPLRKTWGDLCSAFLVESRWFASSSGSENFPNSDEYLRNAKVSSGVHVVLVHVLYLLGFGTSSKSSTTLDDISGIVSSVATILRLWDDLGCSKDEGQNGYDGSYINYYLNENEGVSVESARDHISSMISEEWKRLNMELLRLDRSSRSFQKASLNLARMIPLMYDYNQNRQLPDLQLYIKSMLVDYYGDRVISWVEIS